MSNPVERLAIVLKTMSAKYADRLNAMKARAKDLEREDFIWHALLESLATWGNSRGAEGLKAPGIRERLDYYRVIRMPLSQREAYLSGVLTEARFRYYNRSANFLVRNAEKIAALGGLEGARKRLLALSGFEAKAAFLEAFVGINEKYSRAILLGVYDADARDRIALDSRVQEISETLGLDFGGDYLKEENFYRDVAKSAGIDVWTVDRLLYGFKDEVLSGLESSGLTKPQPAPSKKQPHACGRPSASAGRRRESNTLLMRRLLLEGASEEEIVSTFSARYIAEGGHKVDPVWIATRVATYRRIAMEDPAVAVAVRSRAAK